MIESPRYDAWADAAAAAALLAIDPQGLGGAVLHAQPGPMRDDWLAALKAMLPETAPVRRAPAHIDDDRLLGGLDLAATLAAARPVMAAGLLRECDGGALVLAMAERCSAATGGRLAAALDAGAVDGQATRFIVIALDESVEPDERPPDVLVERLAFKLDFAGLRPRAASLASRAEISRAIALLAQIGVTDDRTLETICAACSAFGVGSARAALFTLRAARAAAALAGRVAITEEDLALAARLVLAPRALTAPAEPAQEENPPQPDTSPGRDSETQAESDAAADRMVDAVQSALPDQFLAQFLAARGERRGQSRTSGAGALAKSARRGRPLGARPGTLRSGERLDLVATLRAAAPWQALRRGTAPKAALVLVRRGDFRIRRFIQRRESTTIFVVDASGSTALQRLAEAKGAVQNLLADAYVSRARVALIAFRAATADLLLPPTRSVARAKRSLADLPGGGGTPLATAIDTASALAQSERAKGRTPLIVLLTDGRGNVGRDGEAGRIQAQQDAVAAARAVRAAGLAVVFIDTSPRSRQGAPDLAAEMGAAYAALPFVDAGAVVNVVRAHAPSRR